MGKGGEASSLLASICSMLLLVPATTRSRTCLNSTELWQHRFRRPFPKSLCEHDYANTIVQNFYDSWVILIRIKYIYCLCTTIFD